MDQALIFDIQRFSLHDGPGIRTTVFFKGCSLACAWCQNPESLRLAAEMAFYGQSCQGCLACREACPRGAIVEGDEQRIDYARCDACGACVEACPTGSLRLIGRRWSAPELAEEVCKDADFFADSGGGVTLSGGEPVLQAGFLGGFLPRLRERGVEVNLETAGHYPWERLEGLLPLVDLIYFDLKHMDDAAHQWHTGSSNQRILENFARLAAAGAPLQARMPLIPGVNDDPGNIAATARFLRQQGQDSIHCLPYHPWGEAKLPRIASRLAPLGLARQEPEQLNHTAELFEEHHVHALLYD